MEAGDRFQRATDRFVSIIERIGGICLATVAALTFVSVLLRYFLNFPIPDDFDFARLINGIVFLWGIAGACYYGAHIQVDLLWTAAGPVGRRALDLLGAVVMLGAIAVLMVMLGIKVEDSYFSAETTFGLGVVVWPFHLAAWLGVVMATVLLVLRLLRLILTGAAPSRAGEEFGVE